MFIGHGLLAFAIVALAGRAAGWERDHVLHLAVLAGAFATLPDVDMAYAPVGLVGGVSGVIDAADAFWQTGNVVHRVITHSLPVGVVAAVAFGLWASRSREDPSLAGTADDTTWPGTRTVRGLLAAGLLVGLVIVAVAVTGGLAGIVMALFLGGGLAITTIAARRGIGAVPVVATALLGLVTHPFGDMVTGTPPAMFYPFETAPVVSRVLLSGDPTLHLVAAFVLELSTFWLATYAFLRLRDRRLRDYVSPRAAAGFGYAGAALVLPAPTLAVSYHFVFTVLAVGFVGTVGLDLDGLRRSRPLATSGLTSNATETTFQGPRSGLGRVGIADVPTAWVTGLSAVTLAVAGYTVAYLVL
jgi:membrane-bound metal-dependent hydrolase YbcI (DUF457 family)